MYCTITGKANRPSGVVLIEIYAQIGLKELPLGAVLCETRGCQGSQEQSKFDNDFDAVWSGTSALPRKEIKDTI